MSPNPIAAAAVSTKRRPAKLTDRERSLLEHRLGEERWRRVWRAGLGSPRIDDDPLLAAAAAEMARHFGAYAKARAILGGVVMAGAALQLGLRTDGTARWGAFAAAALLLALACGFVWYLRRARQHHAGLGDYDQLKAFVAERRTTDRTGSPTADTGPAGRSGPGRGGARTGTRGLPDDDWWPPGGRR